ncbi:MAG: heme-binding domain-containing protein [Flavobacteriaceae bacterium]|nr:heme-binding domain-containing protein [Flavobacteriaceae bacterium]
MIKKLITVFLILFAIAQFFNPQKNEYTSTPESDFILTEKPPQQLAAILKESCYDCHSNNTRYPWYDRITPVNFWLNGHIKGAKKELNFSLWNQYSAKRKAHKLEECIEMINERKMPLESYLLTHGEAKLSDSEIKILTDWIVLLKIKYETTDLPM